MISTGWVGVDLDGTLAEYHYGDLHQFGMLYVGPPIMPMVTRVKTWIELGETVKIFTARVAHPNEEDRANILTAIEQWCLAHIGQILEITNMKDYQMRVLYDDRAVQVEANTGRLIGEDRTYV